MSSYIRGRQDAYSDLISDLHVNLHELEAGEPRKYSKKEIIELITTIKKEEINE